jgi:diguanylate cyclase (GGDEF)-like protein
VARNGKPNTDYLAPEIHPLSLAFEPPVERDFMAEYLAKSLGQIRFTLLVGALYYCGFGFLDAAVAPASLKTLWIIRFAVFLPASGLVFGLTYLALFRRIWQRALSLWALLAGLGIVAMVGVVEGEARSSYYAGLIMVFLVLYTWTRIRFVWATLVGWLIVAAYEILTLGFLHFPGKMLLTHNFFFIGSNILGMFACYAIERYARLEFVMSRLLREEEEKVHRTNLELTAANEALKRLARVDDLTKIPNRRMFDYELKRGWRRMVRQGRPLSLLLCDVDNFKAYNDAKGHLAGDDCLVKVAQAVAAAARRPGDEAARFGGDEFAVILLDTNIEGAVHVADVLCQSVWNLRIPQAGPSDPDRVTVSVGVASVMPTHQRNPDDLVRKADECLYQAKSQGRNKVVSARL